MVAAASRTARGKWEPLQPHPVKEWPQARQDYFKALGPVALWVASPQRPVSVATLSRSGESVYAAKEDWYGGNPNSWRNGPRGCVPVQLGLALGLKDTITRQLDRDAFVPIALRGRFWTPDVEIEVDEQWAWAPAYLLARVIARVMADAAEKGRRPLRNGWIDAGAYFHPYSFGNDFVLPAANDLGLKVWSDTELAAFVCKAMVLAGEIGITSHQERAFKGLCLCLIEAEQRTAHALGRKGMQESDHTRAPAASPTSFAKKVMDAESARAIEEWTRQKRMRDVPAE